MKKSTLSVALVFLFAFLWLNEVRMSRNFIETLSDRIVEADGNLLWNIPDSVLDEYGKTHKVRYGTSSSDPNSVAKFNKKLMDYSDIERERNRLK